MTDKKTTGQFTKEEADERFEAALRGARIAEQKPMKNITKKQSDLVPKSKKRSPR